MTSRLATLLLILFVIFWFIGVTKVHFWGEAKERAYNIKAYAAWVKLTGRDDITLEEFVILKNSRLITQRTK